MSNISERNDALANLHPRDPYSVDFTNIPEPGSANAFCKISVIRTGLMKHVPLPILLLGAQSHETIAAPSFSYLIERQDGSARVVFELGLRNSKDHTQQMSKMMGKLWDIEFNDGAARVLEANNTPLYSISAVILGHSHFDHIGNFALFPKTTSLVVGPGSPAGSTLAYEMDIDPSVLEGRRVVELDRETISWETVGALLGFDYFGDGSLWLLDTPGHKEGHLTALVRVSTNPPVYHLLGSDAAHLICFLQPHVDSNKPHDHFHAGIFPENIINPSAPSEALGSMHVDLAKAYESMAKITRMDQESNINVTLAHDISMEKVLPPGDFVPLEGTLEELTRFKNRDRDFRWGS